MIQALPKHKKGGVISNTIAGVGALVVMVIITFVIVQTLTGANLLGTGTVEANTTADMVSNLSAGIDNVSEKIPTILLIVAVVFLFGALVLLVAQSRAMGIGGGGSI